MSQRARVPAFTGSVKCLPSNSVTALTTASYSVLSTATSYTANSFTKGTTKTPVPTNCQSQTLTGDINVTLQGSAIPAFNDSLSAHSSADLFLGDNAPVKLALVSNFVNVQVHPNINVNPTIPGKVLVVLFCKKDFNDGDPLVLADQEKWSLPNPLNLQIGQTTLGTAQIENNKVGKADVDGNGCVDAKVQFQVHDTGIQCGDTSVTFHTVVPMCIEETVCTGNKNNPNCSSHTTCSGDPGQPARYPT